MQPINIVDDKLSGSKGGDKPLAGVQPTALMRIKAPPAAAAGKPGAGSNPEGGTGTLQRMQRQVEEAMKTLIDAKKVSVRRQERWLDIEINTDILFPSGASGFAPAAAPVLDKLAEVLKPFPNSIRVEGHTDDRPIRTAAFPSNWELSAARAPSVVHLLTQQGVDPLRLEIVGYGEFRPLQSNDTPEGRNANRRVAILVLEDTVPAADVPPKPP
jgi:chemotaxis protein MotB